MQTGPSLRAISLRGWRSNRYSERFAQPEGLQMFGSSRPLVSTVVIGLFAASAHSQEFSADLQRRTPADALLCVEVTDLPRLLESLSETSVGKAVNRLPLARIWQKIRFERNWEGDNVVVDDWNNKQSSLLAELSQVFSGSSSWVVMPEGESVGYCVVIGLSQDSPAVRALERALLDDHRLMGLMPEEGDYEFHLYRHGSGLFLGFDGER